MPVRQESHIRPMVGTPGSENATSDWEDISDSENTTGHASATHASGTQAPREPTSPRKRRRGAARTPPPHSSVAKARRRREPIVKSEDVEDTVVAGVRYVYDVGKTAMRYMRRPFSVFLCLWMLAQLVSLMSNTIRSALSPLCFIPGMGRTTLCMPVQHVQPDFHGLTKAQGSMFDQLVVESAGGSELSLEVIKAEMATKDLSTLVRNSEIKSRDTIADMLYTISRDAKKTARGLSKLNAKVTGAVDEVMALNNYAMQTIGEAQKNAPSSILQAIVPFKLGPTADEIIVEAFTLAMDQSEQTIGRLVVEAEVSAQNLDQMEVDIDTLHGMVTDENKSTSTEKDQLLGHLWTTLGGNRQMLREYDEKLALLNDLADYRKKARAHVTAALQALHAMSDDLEDLRERVAAPGIIGGKVPLHVHIDSIKNGLERLKEGRTRAREIGDATARKLLGPELD